VVNDLSLMEHKPESRVDHQPVAFFPPVLEVGHFYISPLKKKQTFLPQLFY
jgi:hypothetical protein